MLGARCLPEVMYPVYLTLVQQLAPSPVHFSSGRHNADSVVAELGPEEGGARKNEPVWAERMVPNLAQHRLFFATLAW